MNSENELESTVKRIGSNIKRKLDEQYTQWGNGIEYRKLFNSYHRIATSLGLDITSFAYALQDAGYIQMYNTPRGKRVVYSADCPLTTDEINEQLLQLELNRQDKRGDNE